MLCAAFILPFCMQMSLENIYSLCLSKRWQKLTNKEIKSSSEKLELNTTVKVKRVIFFKYANTAYKSFATRNHLDYGFLIWTRCETERSRMGKEMGKRNVREYPSGYYISGNGDVKWCFFHWRNLEFKIFIFFRLPC